MIITLSRKSLSDGLTAVARAIGSRVSLPWLSHILIDASAESDRVRLFATNLEIEISKWQPANVERPGAFALPARTLIDLVSTLGPGDVTLNLNVHTGAVTVKSGGSSHTIKGMDGHDFPDRRPTNPGGAQISGLRTLVERVAYAASLDEAHPCLQGVNITHESGCLRLAATDGFRIATLTVESGDVFLPSGGVIVPARALQEAARLMGNEPCQVDFSLTGAVIFRNQGAEITANLIEGNFPDYNAITPKSYGTLVTVPAAALETAARQAEIIARESNYAMHINIDPASNSVTVSAQAEETGECEIHLTNGVTVTGPALDIAFNINFVRDFLSAVKSSDITIYCNSNNTPAMFRPDDGGFECLIMPMLTK